MYSVWNRLCNTFLWSIFRCVTRPYIECLPTPGTWTAAFRDAGNLWHIRMWLRRADWVRLYRLSRQIPPLFLCSGLTWGWARPLLRRAGSHIARQCLQIAASTKTSQMSLCVCTLPSCCVWLICQPQNAPEERWSVIVAVTCGNGKLFPPSCSAFNCCHKSEEGRVGVPWQPN